MDATAYALEQKLVLSTRSGPSRTQGTVKGASQVKNEFFAKNTSWVASSAWKQAGEVRSRG